MKVTAIHSLRFRKNGERLVIDPGVVFDPTEFGEDEVRIGQWLEGGVVRLPTKDELALATIASGVRSETIETNKFADRAAAQAERELKKAKDKADKANEKASKGAKTEPEAPAAVAEDPSAQTGNPDEVPPAEDPVG